MINYKKGNLFNDFNETNAIINTVNCVGVMGKGIALQFKERFPENFNEYITNCNSGELTIGKSFVYAIPNTNPQKFIINFPTKNHWRNPSKLEYIEKGLDNLVNIIDEYNLTSVTMPALGCGNGNLDWELVKPLIEKKLSHLENITFTVYEPNSDSTENVKKPSLTLDRKKLLLLIDDYNKATHEERVTYIQVSILSYFLNFNSSNLNYVLTPTGPYLKAVNNILLSLEPYYIEVTLPKTNNRPKVIEVKNIKFPNYKVVKNDKSYMTVKKLIEGFETYESLFTLSICHWFKIKLNKPDKNTIYDWLHENNHSINKNLIEKSFNRLNKIFLESENLSFDLNI